VEKPSTKGGGISNCPQSRGGLQTLLYNLPQCSKGKKGGGD
jgi:hypothetical protein